MNASERRAVKRGRIVEIVKGTEEYHGASQQVKDACPDPSDHSITKRKWERVFNKWRADLKASITLVDSPSGDAPSTREADAHQGCVLEFLQHPFENHRIHAFSTALA